MFSLSPFNFIIDSTTPSAGSGNAILLHPCPPGGLHRARHQSLPLSSTYCSLATPPVVKTKHCLFPACLCWHAFASTAHGMPPSCPLPNAQLPILLGLQLTLSMDCLPFSDIYHSGYDLLLLLYSGTLIRTIARASPHFFHASPHLKQAPPIPMD